MGAGRAYVHSAACLIGNIRDNFDITKRVPPEVAAQVSSKKPVEQLRRELRALEELMFLLSPERRKRLKPMIDEVRQQVAETEGERSVEEALPRRA
jgi:hypothetical protein